MNNKIIQNLRSFSSLVWELSKAGTLIVLIIVLVFLLLGDGSGPYVRSVVLNVGDRKSTRLNQSHSDLVCRLLLEKKKK